MTQDEIIEMAAQAELLDANWMPEELMAFAKLVAEREREACAIECEKIALALTEWPNSSEGLTAETKLMRSLGEFVHKPFTEAIRARGQA